MSKRCCSRNRLRRVLRRTAAGLAAAFFCLCISMRLTPRGASCEEGDYMMYYIVNADGMKGLGHSIVLLVDGEGCGTVLSFNGMQRTLGESLMGKSGVGKLSMGILTKEETDRFLQTGDLELEEDQLADNYDAALYRPVTEEEYAAVLEQTAPYIAVQEQFAAFYEKQAMEEDPDKKAEYLQVLEQLGQDESLPLYQIYTNNCDDAARLLISAADPSMEEYIRHSRRMTPNGGVMFLGRQTLWERALMFFVIF